jgi:2-oxo-4-hydroxy-4-carboxy-5-ureidoimidazoline decarboxylase
VTLDELNALPADAAERTLKACGGSSRWVTAMLARRPFASHDALLAAADSAWHDLGPNDWREAIAAHPRIGDAFSPHSNAQAQAWSMQEQSGVAGTDSDSRFELAQANREYEARFGHIFLVHATGKGFAEVLQLCRERMLNSPEDELAVAGDELRKIARTRLEKLLGATEEERQ